MLIKDKPTLQINLLGSMQVRVGETTAEFRTDALRVLLAYLAAHQGLPQCRDTLAGVLSPDRPDKEALTYLRNRLTRLRDAIRDEAAVPPWLDVDRKQITLRNGRDIKIDVTQFERLLAAVETHPHRQLAGCPACLAQLQEAVALVRGEFLAGLNFPSDTWESWLIAQREHYQQQALEAMGLLREAGMVRGEWSAVLDVAQRQLTMEPWLETAHRALMLAHYHLGDRNAALAQFVHCEERLWEELGVEPERETQQLRQQIFDKSLAGSAETPVPDNLPLQTGLFFGRESEQAQLLQRLVDPNYRLITLVGAGGIGKTRLAVEVGKRVKMSFPDGVWFVHLDPIKCGMDQIKIAVGEAAGLGQGSQQLTGEQVIAILRDRRMLIIFDNCEVVLDELGFIPEWLRRAPQVAILATSRERLNFQAESVMTVEGLPTSETEMNAAESLFAERGQMVRDDFVVSAQNLPHIRQICQLVDGSPLGIALAAAWVRRRSLPQIIDSIGRSLDFLSTRLRDVDTRHRSMRAVFETSWQLLNTEEQAVLAALSVFPTSFTAEAAERIAGASLYNLDPLCEKSLLQQQREPERYILHSLVRQFAADKLAEQIPTSPTPAIDRAFVTYFYHYARQHQEDYLRLQPEWRNFLAAINKAHALTEWQSVLDFVAVLDEAWFRQIRFNHMLQGLGLAKEAAAALQDKAALARTLLRLGQIEIEVNDYETAESHLTGAMQHFMLLEDRLGFARAKYLFGRIKNEQAQDDQALALFEDSRRIFAEENDLLGVAKNLNLIAVCHAKKYRDFQMARDYLEESAALQKQLPPTSTYIETLRNLARVTGWAGAEADAEKCLIEAAEISRQLNDLGEYAAVLYERVLLCKRRHQYQQALAFGYESLENFRKLGSLRWEALLKTQLGLLHQAQGDYPQAEALLNEGLQIFQELGDSYEQAYSYYYLYQLYKEASQPNPSQNAKEHALRLNLTLNDPQLQQRLA